MKHRNLAEATIAALQAVFQDGEVASRAVERTIAEHLKWGKRDRNEFSSAVYEIVRWRRLLELAAGQGDEWSLLGAYLVRGHSEIPMWPEFETLDATDIVKRLEAPDLPRALRESVPNWLDELGEAQLGARWDGEIAALNREAPVVLRANTLVSSRDELARELLEAGLESKSIEGVPDGLQLMGRPKLHSLAAWKRGAFEVQDAASQLVAPFLQIEPGCNVVDACAGAGGKTLHLAALLHNQGKLLALDTSSAKLDELQRRARRAGANVMTRIVDKQLLRDSRAFADRLLLDMPCSGSGTLRRQPDLKWRLSPEFLAQLQERQRQILRDYASMLRPGGLLVYATCSLFTSENEQQIETFLAGNPGFELEETLSISPAQTGFDGFWMARLRKK